MSNTGSHFLGIHIKLGSHHSDLLIKHQLYSAKLQKVNYLAIVARFTKSVFFILSTIFYNKKLCQK